MSIWSNFPKIKINTILPILLIFLLVGCSQANNGAGGDKDHPDMITMAWPRDIGEMNPHIYNPSQLFAQSMIYEPLVSYQKNGKLKPELANRGMFQRMARCIRSILETMSRSQMDLNLMRTL